MQYTSVYTITNAESFWYRVQPEKTYHCTVSNLQRLKNSKEKLGTLLGHEKSASMSCVIDFPGAVNCRKGCCKIRQNTSKTNNIGLTRDFGKTECVFDRFL
jgi:hypothetical protein